MVVAALLTAMTCVATMVVQIPITVTGGYVNMGDAVLLFTSYLLGPLYGAIAGGVGSALADLFSGYAVFVPATLIIKACMGALAGFMFKYLSEKPKMRRPIASIICGFCGETIMVLGYFLFAAIFLLHSVSGAAAEVVGNLIQAAFGIVVSTLLNELIRVKI